MSNQYESEWLAKKAQQLKNEQKLHSGEIRTLRMTHTHPNLKAEEIVKARPREKSALHPSHPNLRPSQENQVSYATDTEKKRAAERRERIALDTQFMAEAYDELGIAKHEFVTGNREYLITRDEVGLWEVSRVDGQPVPKSFCGRHTSARRAWDAIRKGTSNG